MSVQSRDGLRDGAGVGLSSGTGACLGGGVGVEAV